MLHFLIWVVIWSTFISCTLGARAHEPQLLKPACLEPVLHNKRSHRSEKPAHCNEEQPPLATVKRKPACSNEDPTQPKINK